MQAQLSVAWYMVVKCLYLQNPFSFMGKIKDFLANKFDFYCFVMSISKSMLSSLKPLWINVVIKLKRHIYHNPKMSEHFDCFIFVRNVKYWFRQLHSAWPYAWTKADEQVVNALCLSRTW